MSCIHYKFKSSLDYNSVTFDGLHLSLADLKKSIGQQKRLKPGEFDLEITNAQTGDVYKKSDELIAKNTSVIVSRVPVTKTTASSTQKSWEAFKQECAKVKEKEKQMTLEKLKQTADLASAPASEIDKIKAVIDQSTKGFEQASFVNKHQTGVPYEHYVCKRCGQKGHYVYNCPNTNPEDRIIEPRYKRTTGIPTTLLTYVDDPLHPGALLTHQGKFAVPTVDVQGYKETKKERPPFLPGEKQPEPEKKKIPQELLCHICEDLCVDAAIAPCCGTSFCDECLREVLLESDDHQCPSCKETNVSPDRIVANRSMRLAVTNFLNDSGYTKVKRRRSSSQSGEGIAPALHQSGTKPPSPTEPPKPLDPGPNVNSSPTYTEPRPVNQQPPEPKPVNQQHPQPGPHVPGHFSHRPPYHGSVRGGYRPQFSSSYSYTRPPRFAPNQYTKPWRFENNQNSNNEANTISTISRRPDYSQTPYADEPPPASQPTDDGRSSSAEPAAPGTSPAADRRSSTESKIPSSSSIWPPVSSPKHTAPPTLANTAISLPSHPSIPVTRPVPLLSVPPMGHQPFTAIPPNFPHGFPVPRPAGPVVPAPGIPPPVPLTREEFYQAKKMFQATDVQPKKPVDVFDSFADFTKRRSRSPERRGSYSRSDSGSPWVKKSRSRSFSPDKRRSRSLSPRRYTPRSRSRSGPRSSIRSRSRSKPRSQNRSRSRSGGRLLNRSRSRSYDSKRLSRPRSRSRTPPRLKSRSRSRSGHRLSKPLSPRNRSPLPPLRRSSKSPLPPLRRSSKSPPPLRRSSKSPLPPLRRSSKSPLRPLRSRSRSLSYRRLSRSRSKSWSKRARSRSRSYSRPKSPRPLSPRRSPWRSPRRSPPPRSPFRKRSYSPRRRSRSFSPRKRSPYRSRSRTPLSKRKSRSRTRSPLPKKRSLTPLHSPRRSKSPYKKPLSPLPFTGFRRRSPSPFRGRGGYRGRGRGGYGGYRDFNKENRDRPRNHASPPMPSGQAPPLPPHNLPPVPYLPQMGLPPPEEYFKYNPQGYQDFVRSFYAQFGPQAQAWAQNQTFSLPTGDGFNAGASGSAAGAPGQRPPWETVPMSPSHRPRSITPPPGNQLGDRKEMSYRDRDAGGDRPWQKDREGGGNRPGDRERDRQDHRDRERDRQPDRNRDGYKYQDRDRGRDPDRYRREGDRRERGRDDDRNKSRDDDRNKSRDEDRNKNRDDDRNKNRDNYRDRDNKEKERDSNKSRDKSLSDRRRSPSRKGKEEEKSRGKDKKKTDKKKDGKENKRSKSQAENDNTKNSTEPKDSSATKSSTREEKDNQAQPAAKAEKADKSMENQSPLKVKNESAESEKQNVDQSLEAGAGDAATTEKVGKSAGKEKKTAGKKKGDGAGTKKKLKDSSGEGGAATGEKKVKKVKKKKLTFGAPDADIKQGLKKKKGKRLVDYKSENCTSEEGEEKNSLSASPTKKARLAEIKEEDTDTAKSGNENSQVSSSEATMEVNTDKSQAKQAVKQEAAGDDTGSSETARVGDKAEHMSAELPLSKWEMEEDFDYFENLDQPREKPQEKMMLPRSVVDKAEKFLSLKPMKNAVMVGHVTSTKSPETSPDKPTSESKTSSPPSNKSSRRVFLDQKKNKNPEDLQITVKTDKRKNENASKRGSATSRSEDHHRHHHHHHHHQNESDDYEEDQRSVVRSQSLERELQDSKSSRSHKDKSEKSSKKDRSSRGSVGEKVTRQDSKKDRSDSGKEKHEHSPEHRERRHSKDGGSAAYSDAPTKSSKDLRHKLEEKNKSKSAVDHRKLSVMDESEFVPDYEDAEGASDNERDDATTSQNSGISTPETPDAKDSKKRKRSADDENDNEDEEKTKDDRKPDGEEGAKHKKSKKKHKHKEKNKDKKEKHKHKKKKHKHKKSKEKEGKQKVNKEQDSS